VTHERYITYDNRASSFYAPYRSYQSPIVYHDSFSPFLMGWLMSDSLNSHNRAMWVYNHRDQIDDARYAELLRHDAKLQAELDLIRASNLKPDANYVPQEFAQNPDLMYAKDAVSVKEPMAFEKPPQKSSFWTGVGWAMLIGVVVVGAYLVFVKDWA